MSHGRNCCSVSLSGPISEEVSGHSASGNEPASTIQAAGRNSWGQTALAGWGDWDFLHLAQSYTDTTFTCEVQRQRVCLMYGFVCVIQQRLWPIFRNEPQKRYHRGLPGEISARKATAECGAISGMMGLGCPAPVIQKVLHFMCRSKMQAKQFGPVKKHNVLWECSNNLPSLFSPLFWLLERHRLCLQAILGEICLMVLRRVFPLIRNQWFFISITSKDRDIH